VFLPVMACVKGWPLLKEVSFGDWLIARSQLDKDKLGFEYLPGEGPLHPISFPDARRVCMPDFE